MQETSLLQELAEVDLRFIAKDQLADASQIVLDDAIPLKQRPAFIMEKLKNPYCFRVGEIGVKVEYSDHGAALQDLFASLLRQEQTGL